MNDSFPEPFHIVPRPGAGPRAALSDAWYILTVTWVWPRWWPPRMVARYRLARLYAEQDRREVTR